VALQAVSFQIPRGASVGIIGRNASGKSTLLACLSRVYRPTSGECHVHGRLATLLELGGGFHPELTGIENIYLMGVILGMRGREVRQRLDEIVAYAELERFIDAQVKTYSSGMIMRLGFALAVHSNPEVLIIDEVLAVGDEAFQAKCLRTVKEFQDSGCTILFVSHDMHAVESVCQRAIWLDRGVVRADGPASEVVSAYHRAQQDHPEGIGVPREPSS